MVKRSICLFHSTTYQNKEFIVSFSKRDTFEFDAKIKKAERHAN